MRPHMETLRQAARAQVRSILQTIRATKLPINLLKCNLTPLHEVTYLGFLLNSRSMTVKVPTAKARAIEKQIKKTLRNHWRGTLKVRHLATTIGQLLALKPVYPQARLYLRRLQIRQTQALRGSSWRLDPYMTLDLQCITELQWWLDRLRCSRRQPLRPPITHTLTVLATDASRIALAAALISHPDVPTYTRTTTHRERRAPIHLAELKAAKEGTLHFRKLVRGTHLNIRTDSIHVVAAINQWGTKDARAIPHLQTLFQWADTTNTTLTATYINTRANTLADRLSRNITLTQAELAEMRLLLHSIRVTRHHTLHWVCTRGGISNLLSRLRTRPIDINTQRRPQRRSAPPPRTLHPKNKRTLFAFPQPNQVDHLLRLAQSSANDIIALLPLWPAAPWFNKAAQLSVSLPHLLSPGAITPSHQYAPSRPNWEWIGVRLSGRRSKRLTFRRGLGHVSAYTITPTANMLGPGRPFGPSPRTLKYLQHFLDIALQAKF